jgi:large subunit ribosomal protein L1
MRKRSKRYRADAAKVDATRRYEIDEAVKILKGFAPTKLDSSVEVAMKLSVDPKKSDQNIRGSVALPKGIGKTRRVIVFCRGEQELQAKEAGADAVGAADLIEKIQGGWMDFDVAVATPDLMRDVSRLGKILGPRGLMPNPKAGTVTDDVAKAVTEVKQGKVEFKMDKLANIHFVIGKRSFEPQQLVENGRVAVEAIVRARPSAVKGRLINRMSLSSTMSPGIPLRTEGLEADASTDA